MGWFFYSLIWLNWISILIFWLTNPNSFAEGYWLFQHGGSQYFVRTGTNWIVLGTLVTALLVDIRLAIGFWDWAHGRNWGPWWGTTSRSKEEEDNLQKRIEEANDIFGKKI